MLAPTSSQLTAHTTTRRRGWRRGRRTISLAVWRTPSNTSPRRTLRSNATSATLGTADAHGELMCANPTLTLTLTFSSRSESSRMRAYPPPHPLPLPLLPSPSPLPLNPRSPPSPRHPMPQTPAIGLGSDATDPIAARACSWPAWPLRRQDHWRRLGRHGVRARRGHGGAAELGSLLATRGAPATRRRCLAAVRRRAPIWAPDRTLASRPATHGRGRGARQQEAQPAGEASRGTRMGTVSSAAALPSPTGGSPRCGRQSG